MMGRSHGTCSACRSRNAWTPARGKRISSNPHWPGTPSKEWVRDAFYSASMGASLNVQLALRDLGWTWKGPRKRLTGDVRVVLEHADGSTVEVFGPLNEGLCRAALKALMTLPNS